VIEVRGSKNLPLGMTPARFLREFWQKKPLLIRGFATDGFDSVSPDDLAGLACEEAALVRIVSHDPRHDRWSVRSGPFRERDFARLGKKNWTLLVQDVDKWDMDVAAVLDRVSFVPTWRVDDVMISYATDGGGVGPHVDQYDVFLVQGMGWRRWRISTDARASKEFRTDSDLRLLAQFSPTHEWLLESGDALYLPPGVPHDGIAIGECMTWSIGMRAPAQSELLLDLAEFLAEPLGEEQRYADPDLAPAKEPGEIDDAAVRRVRAALPQFANVDDATFAHWFGRFITRYRSAQMAVPPDRVTGEAALLRALPGATLLRNPFTRFAWRRVDRVAELFAAGDAWPCSLRFARLISATREIAGDALAATCADMASRRALLALLGAGHVQIARRRRRAR